jgi:hypothetical protein
VKWSQDLPLITDPQKPHLKREMRNVYIVLVGKPEWKRPLGRPRYRWEEDIRVNLRETGWKDVDWMHLAQDMA